jgi:hypothetical protein
LALQFLGGNGRLVSEKAFASFFGPIKARFSRFHEQTIPLM